MVSSQPGKGAHAATLARGLCLSIEIALRCKVVYGLPTVTWTELWKAGPINQFLNLYHAVVPLSVVVLKLPALHMHTYICSSSFNATWSSFTGPLAVLTLVSGVLDLKDNIGWVLN